MKIAVIGCGAMGSIYAAKLAAAGNDVLGVDRHRPSIDAIARNGLRVTGPESDQVVRLRASPDAPVEAMDLIVLAVKAAEPVAEIVGPQRVAVGIASGFGAARIAPGHVHHNAMRALRFGAYSSLPYAAVVAIAQAWSDAGFDAAAVTDIAAMQWEKLICNAAYSAPCALNRMTVGQVMDDAEMGPVSRAAATEAWTVACASGIAVAVSDPVAHVRAFGAGMPDAKPSALLDHEAHRVSEVDVINGAVPRQGARVGVAAPVNATLTAVIKSIEKHW